MSDGGSTPVPGGLPLKDTPRVAVLVDCDNIGPRHGRLAVAEASRHGRLSVKRAYGDWSSPLLVGWKKVLPELAFQPVHQPAYTTGKNSTDTAVIIDAMDLLYGDTVDVFCIVSSDSDFTRLAMRLREAGRLVYGIGAQSTAPSFRNACDRFTFVEVLAGQQLKSLSGDVGVPGESAAGTAVTPHPEPPSASDEIDVDPEEADTLAVPDIEDVLIPAIRATGRDDGWALLAAVGINVVNNHPSFDSRNYGYPKLGRLVEHLGFVEVRRVPDANGFAQTYVRLADDDR